MTTDQQENSKAEERDPFLAAAEIALRRAAARARRLSNEPSTVPEFGPDSMMGGLTQQEIGEIRQRLDPKKRKT